jgi:hypothetical protein
VTEDRSDLKLSIELSKKRGVVRFKFDGSIRIWRYVFFGVIFILFTLYRWFDHGGFTPLDIAIFFGYVVIVLVLNEFISSRVRKRVVEFDFDLQELRLAYAVYPLSFFDIWRKKEVVIPFRQIRTVHRLPRYKGMWEHVYVYTDKSWFTVSDYFERYDELMSILNELAGKSIPVPLRRNHTVLGFTAGVIGLSIVFGIGWYLGWI